MKKTNQDISLILNKIKELLEIKETSYKSRAYQKAAYVIGNMDKNIYQTYQEKGSKGLKEIPGIGQSIAEKIEEYLKTDRIKYFEELKKETAIQEIIAYYFKTKGVSLVELKKNAQKKKIIYSRYTRSAKQLLELAGSTEKAKEAIDKVSKWAISRKLDYAIETIFKKWLELDKLKPKEIIKKPFFRGKPMVWSENYKKWYVINDNNEWLEFAGKEDEIEWKIIK